MATKHTHPARSVTIFLLVIVAMFGGMALMKTWTPKLGLDLRGGTTITLTAKDGVPDSAALALARTILERRVNSLGVGETSVTVSGNRQVVVAVPNVQSDQLANLVGQTAQLKFRRVLALTPNTVAPTATAAPGASASGSARPTASATPAAITSGSPAPSASASGNGRVPAGLPTAPPTPRPTADPATISPLADRLAYAASPQDQADLAAFTCGDAVKTDLLSQPLITCDKDKAYKFLLGPVLIQGAHVTNAQAGVPQNQLAWQVDLSFDGTGASEFEQTTTALAAGTEPTNELGIVLDGQVISWPRVSTTIAGGSAQITGSFSQTEATDLANVLKFGALPVTFETSQVSNVSASLGRDQLTAGIIAGLIGLALVVVYCFVYYRGLGAVVVASLGIAGLLLYAVLVLLGQSLGLALNLPGIAGAIVAIGITADSFVIYFERIRDEVRDGRSLRTAIESGWRKARSTIVIADCVSLLSAGVLFFLAMGAVKGFAFTLGLTTLIDLAIIFLFSHPLVSLLGRTEFFGKGHKGSGLEAEHMGVDSVEPIRVPASRRRGAIATTTSEEI